MKEHAILGPLRLQFDPPLPSYTAIEYPLVLTQNHLTFRRHCLGTPKGVVEGLGI